MIFYPSNNPNLVSMFFEVVNCGVSLLATLKRDSDAISSGMGDSMNMISRGDQLYDEDEDVENPSPELINVTFKQIISADVIMNLEVNSLLHETLQKMNGVIGSDQYAQLNQTIMNMAGVGSF